MNTLDSTVITSWAGCRVDQSVLKVSASKGVVRAVKNFAKDIEERLTTNERFKDALILAHWESQSYNGELFVDLRDFCERLAARYPEAKGESVQVTAAIRELVRKSCFTGVENQFSNGASIYFPWADVAPLYEQLAFARESGLESLPAGVRRGDAPEAERIQDRRQTAIGFPERQTIQVRVSCPRQSTIQKVGRT